MKATLGTSRLEALLESAHLLHASLDLNSLLGHLLRTVMGRLLASRGLIAISDQDGMRLALLRGLPGFKPGDVFDEGIARAAGIERFFPLGTGDSPAGILGIGRAARRADSDEEAFLNALFGIASSGINNARSHAEVQQLNQDLNRKVQDLRTLLELVHNLTSTVDASEVAHLLALTLAGRWAVGRYAVAAWKDGHPVVRRERGLELPDVGSLRRDIECVEAPLLVSDLPDGRLKDLLQRRQGTVVFPLKAGSSPAGVVVLGPRPGGLAYDESALEFGAGLVDQAMVAFENSWHFQETLEKKKIEQEIDLAAGIQRDLFPAAMPSLEGLDLAARNRPARQVGGDYFDALAIRDTADQTSYLFCVADISGKGIPASLLMSNIQATLRALLDEKKSVIELATRTSELLYATTPSNRYATAILAHIEPATRKIHYVNAGHNDGILIRSNGEVESLKSTGPPLGLIPRIPFQGAEVQMRAGDLLALYSDGIVEAQNPDEIEFGDERFIAALKELAARPAAEMVAEVFERIDRFVDGAPQHDDITLMLIKAV